MTENAIVRVAAVQDAPVFLNMEATTTKVCQQIGDAARGGAKLVVFPEAYVAGYPDWVWMVPNNQRKVLDALYARLLHNAVTVGDETTKRICDAAREAGVHVIVGMNERNAEASQSTVFNTMLYIGSDGSIVGKHRKLVPTGGERLVWGRAERSSIRVYDTPIGRIGGLLCWENYMPLARTTLYQQGIQIHLAPTWDSSEKWLIALRSAAREGGMFVINCCTALHIDDIPDEYEFKSLYPAGREWINKGNSCIINPSGDFLAGPVSASQEILYADLDLDEILAAKRLFDVAGHYARPDVFDLRVRTYES